MSSAVVAGHAQEGKSANSSAVSSGPTMLNVAVCGIARAGTTRGLWDSSAAQSSSSSGSHEYMSTLSFCQNVTAGS